MSQVNKKELFSTAVVVKFPTNDVALLFQRRKTLPTLCVSSRTKLSCKNRTGYKILRYS